MSGIDLEGGPAVMGADGEFHAEDEEVSFAGVPVEAWPALGLFWLLGLTVFYQFYTRYVLNDSASWTEEIARYLLIGVVFTGAAIGVARNNHIQVDLLFRYLPKAAGRTMSLIVDVVRIVFFAAAVVMTVQMMLKLGSTYKMTIIDLPMNIVYAVVLLGFAAMLVRSVWVALVHWRRGYSALERPETTMDDR